jgi:hypothetical protein
MFQPPSALRLTIQLISIIIFVQWAQAGTEVTDSPSRKRYKVRMRDLVVGEAFTNCTCPKDSPMDTKREYCGWEILNQSNASNRCENHTVYRCMDPDPWNAIDHIPCAHYGKRNSDKVHRRCGLDLEPGHTYMRHCIV